MTREQREHTTELLHKVASVIRELSEQKPKMVKKAEVTEKFTVDLEALRRVKL